MTGMASHQLFCSRTYVCRELTLACDLAWEWLPAWMEVDTAASKFIRTISINLIAIQRASTMYAKYGFLVPDVLAAAGRWMRVRM